MHPSAPSFDLSACLPPHQAALHHREPVTAGTGPHLSPLAVLPLLVSAPARLSRSRPSLPSAHRGAAARHQPPGVNYSCGIFCGWRDPGRRPWPRGSRRPAPKGPGVFGKVRQRRYDVGGPRASRDAAALAHVRSITSSPSATAASARSRASSSSSTDRNFPTHSHLRSVKWAFSHSLPLPVPPLKRCVLRALSMTMSGRIPSSLEAATEISALALPRRFVVLTPLKLPAHAANPAPEQPIPQAFKKFAATPTHLVHGLLLRLTLRFAGRGYFHQHASDCTLRAKLKEHDLEPKRQRWIENRR